MLQNEIADYAAYVRLDLSNNFETLQDVIDNMITRLEELTSVVQMVKLKSNDCVAIVSDDLCKYRNEINTLSKKVSTLSNVMLKIQMNTDTLERQVEKAEIDFGVNNDNKLKNFLKPFFRKNKDDIPASSDTSTIGYQDNIQFISVLDNFDVIET